VSLSFYLFGQVPFDDLSNLQRRLAYEAASRDDGRITVLACEHEPVITIGRAGSRADVRLVDDLLVREQIDVHCVARGGGAVLHGPGQLGLYVIAPLARLQWTVGGYLGRLRSGLVDGLAELSVATQTRGEQLAIWGRSGLLAAFGVGVRHGTALYGVSLNVNPDLRLYRRVQCVSGDAKSRMGSLLSERAAAGRMETVRSTLVVSLAAALGCATSQVFTGHPLLPDPSLDREPASLA
jgi:lipoyl(octanoyl) transferase